MQPTHDKKPAETTVYFQQSALRCWGASAKASKPHASHWQSMQASKDANNEWAQSEVVSSPLHAF